MPWLSLRHFVHEQWVNTPGGTRKFGGGVIPRYVNEIAIARNEIATKTFDSFGYERMKRLGESFWYLLPVQKYRKLCPKVIHIFFDIFFRLIWRPVCIIMNYRIWTILACFGYRLTPLTAHDRIQKNMKIFTALRNLVTKPHKALISIEDYKQEALIRQGRIQFEKLLQKGLSVPVALL